MKLAVVIPFFQRQRGFLEAALASVAAQQVGSELVVEIIIVDDGSPIPAASETLPALPPQWSLRIIKQANGGVSRARNRALDAVSIDTKYVAFLDSDDVWFPHHLADAVRSLESGASFFFSNYRREEPGSFFSHRKYMRNFFANGKNSEGDIFFVQGQDFLFHLVREYIAQTSFIVYNFQESSKLRFSEDLRFSSEDHLFWIFIVSKAENVAFSKKISGQRFSGVSLFNETTNWDSPNILNRIIDQIIFQNMIKGKLPDNIYDYCSYLKKMEEHVGDFVFIFFRSIWKRPVMAMKAVLRLLWMFPSLITMFPKAIFNLTDHRSRLIYSK